MQAREHGGFGGSPTGSQQGRDMDVSSGDEEEHPAHAKHKKKHLTEDQQEALHAAKGAKKAMEWLETGFVGYKQVRPSQTNPGQGTATC